MYPYPHTIDNGAGEELTILRRVEDPGGAYVEAENRVAPGAGPPMHVHYLQEEALTVVAGRLGFQRPDAEPQYCGVGETIVFKAGEAHRFWNAGQETLHCTGYVRPPHNIEYFLTEIFRSTKANGGKGPNPIDAAFLSRRYRSEFAILEIPAFVQRFIFPVLILVGRLTGRLRKYHAAPPPVTSG